MSMELAVTYIVAIYVFSVTPGPGTFAVMARALSNGVNSCYLYAAGMTTCGLSYLLAAYFGLSTLATHWSEAFLVIRMIGAAYLLYLAYKIWTAPVDLDVNSSVTPRLSKRKGFVQGFMVSAANPKVVLFYAAFLPTFLDISVLSFEELGLMILLTSIGLYSGFMTVAMFASKVRDWFRSERAVRNLNRSVGGMMAGAAGYLVYNR